MFLPNIFATGDEDNISLVETYFCIMVEVLDFMGILSSTEIKRPHHFHRTVVEPSLVFTKPQLVVLLLTCLSLGSKMWFCCPSIKEHA